MDGQTIGRFDIQLDQDDMKELTDENTINNCKLERARRFCAVLNLSQKTDFRWGYGMAEHTSTQVRGMTARWIQERKEWISTKDITENKYLAGTPQPNPQHMTYTKFTYDF